MGFREMNCLMDGWEESLAFLGLVILRGKQSLCFAFTSFERERETGGKSKVCWFNMTICFLTLGLISHPGPPLWGVCLFYWTSLSLLFQLISDFRFIDTSTFLGLDMVCTIT